MADSSAVTFAAIEQVRAILDRYVNHERSASFHVSLDALQALAEAAARRQYLVDIGADTLEADIALAAALARVRAGT